MPTQGFVNGFYTSKLMFGGMYDGVVINDIIGGVTYLQEDKFYNNLTINHTLYTYEGGGNNRCYKIFCSDTLTLNAGGLISCDGSSLGDWNDLAPSPGFGVGGNGSLGVSGSGGHATLATGASGAPYVGDSLQPVFLGGAGGAGGTHGLDLGGAGGVTGSLDKINNIFQPSVYQSAMMWINPAIYSVANVSATDFINWTGHFAPGYASVPICGGGGGGGVGDVGAGTNGGGACGGGVIYIAANRIVMNGGVISANGQKAIAGSGGGPGGGGVIVLVTNELVFVPGTASQIMAMGAGDSGLGSSNAANGTIILFSDQLVCSFSGVLTPSIYNTAKINWTLKGHIPGS